MPASVFRPMGRIFTTAFADRSAPTILWIRHDSPTPVSLKALFNKSYAPVDADGFEIADAQPTAWVAVAEVRRHETGRDLKVVFDNRDHIVTGGESYAVESCKGDGQQMVQVNLRPA